MKTKEGKNKMTAKKNERKERKHKADDAINFGRSMHENERTQEDKKKKEKRKKKVKTKT